MTPQLFWAFAIGTFITSGLGASCGFASSPQYQDQDQCEQARQAYEVLLMPFQNPQRRLSTTPCTMQVQQPPSHPPRVPR